MLKKLESMWRVLEYGYIDMKKQKTKKQGTAGMRL